VAIPPGVNSRDWDAALRQFRQAVGESWVFTSDEDIALYRDAYSPLWGEREERLVSAAIAPDTTEQVSAVVRTANQFRIPIYPISTGKNLGYGGSAPNLSGSVVIDLKRMNRVIEVDDKRHFAIVEPGVAYFDLYRHIQDRGLKVWIDCPDPGWGSPVGNSLDHGVGYTFGGYRDHFQAHCGLEAVLPTGEVVRTGMGALPGAKTWAEYRYGFGPTVDGLFAQGNLGIVTKMGFHLFPAQEAYQNSVVTVPRRNDLIPLVDLVNELEHTGLVGQPVYGSPLGGPPGAFPPELAGLLKRPGGPPADDLDRFAAERKRGSWTCRLQFYGSPRVIAAHIEHAKERFTSVIPGSTFQDGELLRFPLTQAQLDRVHKVAVGIPNMSIFSIGARTELNPSPSDGHLWFSPIIPKTGEAIFDAQRVFMEAFATLGRPSLVTPFSTPATWMHRAFIFIMAFPISRTNVQQNQRNRETFRTLVRVAAEHGWGEYRTAPAFQDDVMAAYSFNNGALLRLHETIKDAVDPNGIVAAGRSGIWPRHLREPRP
jgi:4-cresol dehydrogenase (hydroxylating)